MIFALLVLPQSCIKGDEEQTWSFETILNHRKVNGKWEIQVLWTTGEETWEPLNWLADQDPISIAMYAKENDLFKKPGWKCFKQFENQDRKYIRTMR